MCVFVMAANQNNITHCVNLCMSNTVVPFTHRIALYEMNIKKVSFHLNKTLLEQNFPFHFIYMANQKKYFINNLEEKFILPLVMFAHASLVRNPYGIEF